MMLRLRKTALLIPKADSSMSAIFMCKCSEECTGFHVDDVPVRGVSASAHVPLNFMSTIPTPRQVFLLVYCFPS